jgi:hypothetical protein
MTPGQTLSVLRWFPAGMAQYHVLASDGAAEVQNIDKSPKNIQERNVLLYTSAVLVSDNNY